MTSILQANVDLDSKLNNYLNKQGELRNEANAIITDMSNAIAGFKSIQEVNELTEANRNEFSDIEKVLALLRETSTMKRDKSISPQKKDEENHDRNIYEVLHDGLEYFSRGKKLSITLIQDHHTVKCDILYMNHSQLLDRIRLYKEQLEIDMTATEVSYEAPSEDKIYSNLSDAVSKAFVH
jgi:hypothetical protein